MYSLVEMCTRYWQRINSSFVSPDCSRPKTSATRAPWATSAVHNPMACSISSDAHVRVRCRALKPYETWTSESASSRLEYISICDNTSSVRCAETCVLSRSIAAGLTRRNRLKPMFFMARMTVPKLIGFCGSTRTIRKPSNISTLNTFNLRF